MIKNLTPHPIKVRRPDGSEISFPPEGLVPRVEAIETPSTEVKGIPTVTRKMGQVTGIPEPCDGVFYLVSSFVFEASERTDLLAPDTGKTCVRDEKGNIVAVTRLIRKR
jgi:hypothetical protein